MGNPEHHWLLYLHPDRLTPAFVDFLMESGKILPYLDVPVQHIDDTILSRMNRAPAGEHIRRMFRYLREKNPLFALRTTIMTGFPGETEVQFRRIRAAGACERGTAPDARGRPQGPRPAASGIRGGPPLWRMRRRFASCIWTWAWNTGAGSGRSCIWPESSFGRVMICAWRLRLRIINFLFLDYILTFCGLL